MRFISLVWRGTRDVFEQLVYMGGLSLGWWLCAAPLLGGVFLFFVTPLLLPVTLLTAFLVPPATVTLFSLADPRRMISRPDFAEARHVFTTSIKRGWTIALATVPFLLILFWNITFFIGQSSFWAAFVPLWMIMFIFLFIVAIYMFSLAGTMESRLRNAFRGGMFVLITRPFTAALLSILIMVIGAIFTGLVLPMLVIGPALLAAVINRFVFDVLEVDVIDPNKPTHERSFERERGINPDPNLWGRIKRGRSSS